MTREDYALFCSELPGALLDQPFDGDFLTTVARHQGNRKWFALLMELDGRPQANLKCEPLKAGLLRGAFSGIRPGWHMNKDHWITVDLSGDVPDDLVRQLTKESFELTRPRPARRKAEGTE